METNDYLGYELAKKLKAAGFDEPCLTFYDANKELGRALDSDNFNHLGETYQGEWFTDTISAPTLWHVQKWLREKKGIAINVIAHDGGRYHTERIVLPNCTIPESRDWYVETTTPMVYSYEQALSAGLAAALELIKKGV